MADGMVSMFLLDGIDDDDDGDIIEFVAETEEEMWNGYNQVVRDENDI